MKQTDEFIQVPLEEVKLAFAASYVEGAARKLGVPYIEIYNRMRKVDLINKYILPHYEMLHSESKEYLIDDVIECHLMSNGYIVDDFIYQKQRG